MSSGFPPTDGWRRGVSSAGWILLALLCAAGSRVSAQGSVSSTGGGVVGYVTAQLTGEPLGFADVMAERLGIGIFAAANGVFRLRGLPAGPVSIV